jgi:light-regulated signal transduction histidine kinase (bacteriophytochrome)
MTETSSGQWPRFFDRLVHDMREPLRGINSFSQLLRETAKGKLGPEDELALNEIVNGAAKIAVLTEAISQFSSALRPPDKPGAASLQLAFDMTALALDKRVQESGATLSGQGLPRVAMGLDRLSGLLEKLLANSLTFRGDEPPVISISAAETNDGFWLIRLEDNGLGIEEKNREAVFDPFMRVYGRQYPGAGMGLAVCRKLIENHGGKIWMEAPAERGNVCCFTLPAA